MTLITIKTIHTILPLEHEIINTYLETLKSNKISV